MKKVIGRFQNQIKTTVKLFTGILLGCVLCAAIPSGNAAVGFTGNIEGSVPIYDFQKNVTNTTAILTNSGMRYTNRFELPADYTEVILQNTSQGVSSTNNTYTMYFVGSLDGTTWQTNHIANAVFDPVGTTNLTDSVLIKPLIAPTAAGLYTNMFWRFLALDAVVTTNGIIVKDLKYKVINGR